MENTTGNWMKQGWSKMDVNDNWVQSNFNQTVLEQLSETEIIKVTYFNMSSVITNIAYLLLRYNLNSGCDS